MFAKYIEAKKQILNEKAILEINRIHEKGTVYTPEAISKEMVYLLIVDYLSRHNHLSIKKKEILKNGYLQHSINKAHTYLVNDESPSQNDYFHEAQSLLEIIKPLQIMDLSCGTGLLLLAFLELQIFIMIFLNYSNQQMRTLVEETVNHNVFAFDINQEALNKFKGILSVLFKCLESEEPISETHYIVGDSLLIPIDYKVDLIIGNPPYIGEKGNLDVFQSIKDSEFGAKHYEGKMDYFYFFIYKAYHCLKPTGSLCYLTSNYFFTADGAIKLRSFIRDKFNFTQVLDFNNVKVFKTKNLHACIYTLSPLPQNEIVIYNEKLECEKRIETNAIYHRTGTFHFISDDDATKILEIIEMNLKSRLEDVFNVKQGIVSGADRHSNMPVFVYKKDEVNDLPHELKQMLKPFYKNSDIKHFYHEKSAQFYILYIDRSVSEVKQLEKLLEPFRIKLEKRREVINGVRNWYELTWPRDTKMFHVPKVVVPQRAKSNYFAYSEGEFYASADVYYIIPKDKSNDILLKGLTAFLNSYIVLLYLYYKGKRKGTALELYSTPLKTIPLDFQLLEKLSALYDLKLNENEKIDQVNQIIYDFMELEEADRIWLNNFGRKLL